MDEVNRTWLFANCLFPRKPQGALKKKQAPIVLFQDYLFADKMPEISNVDSSKILYLAVTGLNQN
jgi:hypothetical protein